MHNLPNNSQTNLPPAVSPANTHKAPLHAALCTIVHHTSATAAAARCSSAPAAWLVPAAAAGWLAQVVSVVAVVSTPLPVQKWAVIPNRPTNRPQPPVPQHNNPRERNTERLEKVAAAAEAAACQPQTLLLLHTTLPLSTSYDRTTHTRYDRTTYTQMCACVMYTTCV